MIQELITWLTLANAQRVMAAVSASNLLLILYVISYILNRKAVFLMAFLLSDFIGNLAITDYLSNVQYYLYYALHYSLVYWLIFKRYHMLKPLIGYGIMVLFELGMALDAALYPNTKTAISESYVYIVVAIHLYIIISSSNWRVIWISIKRSIDIFNSMFRCSYDISFFWYTIQNHQSKASKI